MPPTAAERSLQARAAAAARWARADPAEALRPAWAASWRKWEDSVDPDRVLPEQERFRRAESARRAYMLTLSRKAAAARRKKRESRE
jgi:hypothetical protein